MDEVDEFVHVGGSSSSIVAKLDINREEIDALNKNVKGVIEDEEESEH